MLGLTAKTSSVSTLSVEGESPRSANQPGTKAVAVPEVREAPMCPDERLLCHILGVLSLAEHSIRHSERQARGLNKQSLKLPFEIVGQGFQRAGKSVGVVVHPDALPQVLPMY
jgi:hypothetical protein